MSSSLPFYVQADDPPAKREILRAAMKLFSQRGLAGTSIRDIAEESGYTNPALYKHFSSKEELAVHLFETCHQWAWTICAGALKSGRNFDEKLDAYVSSWLELVDEHPELLGFLSDSARVLWPRSGAAVRQHTMIGLARELVAEAPKSRLSKPALDPDVAAASLQGTLAELARMIQVGVVRGPARSWKGKLIKSFRKLLV